MSIQHRNVLWVAAAAFMLVASVTPAAAESTADELSQAQAECSTHNARLRSMEAQHAGAAEIKSERAAYERACARLEILRGTPPGTPVAAEVAASEPPAPSAPAPATVAKAAATADGECTHKQ